MTEPTLHILHIIRPGCAPDTQPRMHCDADPRGGAPLVGVSEVAWASPDWQCPAEATMCIACIAAACITPPPRAPRFDMAVSTQGIARDGWRPGRDATHLAIPLRVYGDSPETCERRAEAIAGVLALVVGDFPSVEWCRSHVEGAYALAVNLTTSLSQLPASDLALVVAAIPSLEDLRRLLTPVEAVASG